MKKYLISVMLLSACLMFYSACSDVSDKNINNELISTAEEKTSGITDTVVSEEYVAVQQQIKEDQHETMQQPEEIEEESEKTAEEKEEPEKIENITNINQIGKEQFDKSCKTQWDYLIDCPYELDYNDTYKYAVRVVGINSISDVLEDYNKVFDGNSPELAEKYIATQHCLYCYDGGRGANIYYVDTELELVSYEGNTAEFIAVSHYADPQTGEAMSDEQHRFVIVRKDGAWKTVEFTLPY